MHYFRPYRLGLWKTLQHVHHDREGKLGGEPVGNLGAYALDWERSLLDLCARTMQPMIFVRHEKTFTGFNEGKREER